MEELYTLPDGSQVDMSTMNQFEKTNFLLKNPGAKKQWGAAKSAGVASKKKKALSQDSDSNGETGSSASKKWRLPTSGDIEIMEKGGVLPPPSANPSTTPVEYIDDYNKIYDLVQNRARNKKQGVDTGKIKIPGSNISTKLSGKTIVSDKEISKFTRTKQLGENDPDTGELSDFNRLKILKAKEQIRNTDSELMFPHLYYSSKNQGQDDTFVEENFSTKELKEAGVNVDDFEGFLNKKGYKNDFLEKQEKGLFDGKGRDFFGGYDIGLGKELAKKKMLSMYMEDMQRRDFTKQDLNQDIEIASGFRSEKEIKQNQLFDPNGISKYVEKNFPILTQKLKDRDKENAKIYQESKQGGTDFFSWDTPTKMGRAGWNAVVDRTAQISASAYEAIGMSGTAEGVRMLDEENKLVRPDTRDVSYVSGKQTKFNGTNYIVDSKGDVYDADSKIRVTDLLDQNSYDNIKESAKYGPSDWIFSTQGAAVQTSGVVADMILQAAITKGVGELGAIATETRAALVGAKKASGFTSLLNDTSQLLRKVPIKRAEGYSMIAQGAIGYSQGFEETLKAARDNGINDKDAFKLASAAAQRMAVLYSTTGIINPQTEVAENIFGSKNIIKKAIEQYTKTGEKGFIASIDDVIKNTPRNLLEFAEEGGKEVVQENIQQVGEIGVNKMTNRDAGQKIMNDVMSGDDFMNTSILSFISSGLISKAKLPSFRESDQAADDLRSLSTLAKNKKEFTGIVDGLLNRKVFTIDEVNKLKQDVDIYANNINKLPKSISAEIAMPVLIEIDKITKLEEEKKTVSKAFHENIDAKIEGIYGDIAVIQYKDELRKSNESISNAIKKGIVKDIQMKTFSDTESLNKYLNEELNIPLNEVDYYSSQQGFALNSKALKKYSKNPDTISDNAQIIITNESIFSGDSGVVKHEFEHGLLQNTIKDNPEAQKLLGVALSQELMKIHDELTKNGSDQKVFSKDFVDRLNAYGARELKQKEESEKTLALDILEAKGDKAKIEIAKAKHEEYVARATGVKWEEIITLYSDALRNGQVTYKESTFTKLGDVIRRVLQYLGLKDIKFESGKDVYNFIKDYNYSVESGNWGKAFKKMGEKGAKINLDALAKETSQNREIANKQKQEQDSRVVGKFSLDDRKSSDAIKKDINSKYNKDTWSEGTNDKVENKAIDNVLYDILEEYDYIIKGKSKALGYQNLPDFSELDMISETQLALIPHIRNFNKEFFQKREEFKKELVSKGIDPKSKEFKDKVQTQDEKGYQGKKGIVKENKDLNAWINSQLLNKMKVALNTGNVTTQKFTEDVEGEMFKESNISDGFGGDQGYLMDEGDSIFETENDFQAEQSKLAVLLSDPVFRFVDKDGKPIDIETIPFGSFFITEASDPTVAANKKLKTETDPAKIAILKRQLVDLERGLELQDKKDVTFEEKEELKSLKSFKSYDLSTGMMVNTFEALSVQDTPAKIITEDVGREILRSPNIATLEYRNFKEKLSTLSKTMARRMTFKNGPEIESLMYNQWKLLYDVINHPVDPVTGESSYASKKLPPRLKELDEKGNLRKIKDITRVKFLQSYYGIDEATRIIRTYGGKNVNKELRQLEDEEVNEKTGNKLWATAYFDRRTALMELFGDVLVLQEARRLIRNQDFLERVAEINVNLYNELKDDITRTNVLESMAKGKSEIVKFSLRIGDEPTSMIESNPFYNNILKTQESLSKGIANNVFYDSESISAPSNIVKFSLSNVIGQRDDDGTVVMYEVPNKKYLNNYKPVFDEEEGAENYIDASKNYYVKVLQYSDINDDGVNSKKLHTLKNYEEVEKEVVSRVQEMINSMRIIPRKGDERPIDPNSRLGMILGVNNTSTNPYIIEEYKEGYIDKMLNKAIEDEDQNYIRYWSSLKEDKDFREEDIYSKKVAQYSALNELANIFHGYPQKNDYKELSDAFHNGFLFEDIDMGLSHWNAFSTVKTDEPNGLKFNPFFTYLFLKDVLSNRYTSNPETEVAERKPFKKSEYKTTIQPIDSYERNKVYDVFDSFSGSNVNYPAFVYTFLNMEANKSYVKEWEKERKVLDWNQEKIFKFNKSSNTEDAMSLSALAAKNVGIAQWCTGQSLSMAKEQLVGGDFFIVTNEEYKPSIAVRMLSSSSSGIGEIVGTEEGQSFDVKDIPTIIEVLKLSNLDSKTKQRTTNALSVINDLLLSRKPEIIYNSSKEDISTIMKDVRIISLNGSFRFQLNSIFIKKLGKKIKNLKDNLISEGLISDSADSISSLVSSNGSNIDLTTDNYDVLEDVVNLYAELEEVFGSNDEDPEVYKIRVKDEENFNFNLPKLDRIGRVEFRNVKTFSAPNLKEGIYLSVQTELDNSFSNLVELPKETDIYDIRVDANMIENANDFVFSQEKINMNKGGFTLFSTFNLNKEASNSDTSIDLSSIENTQSIDVYGLADTIFLPKEVNKLKLKQNSKESSDAKMYNSYIPEEVFIVGLEKINKFEVYYQNEGTKITDFKFANPVKIKETKILSWDSSDEFMKTLIESEIYNSSEEVSLRLLKDGILVDVAVKSKENNGGRSEVVKFSLAEEENGNLSNFLEGLPFSEQWVVARDIDTAIKNSKTANGTKVTFKVPSRSKMSDKSTAYFIIEKVAEGYNDFEFMVKKNANGPLTKQVLDALDFKSKKYQEIAERNANLERTMNEIIEENKGVKASETFSPETAKNLGKNIGKHDIFLPPEDEDFLGLMYTLASGKGKQGQEQLDFLVDNLLKPYSDAMLNLMKARQIMYKDWKELINKKYKGISKVLKQDSGYGGYLNDQAVRVYLWSVAGYEVPGLDKKDLFNLKEKVRTNKELRAFAQDVSLLSKQANGYIEPGHNWGFGSVVGDINNIISKSNRTKYLEPWTHNVEKIFSKQNMSKIEAVYGRNYVKALNDMLARMKTGSNRVDGSSDSLLNWLNGSTAVTMFMNIRSAVLQTIGAVNYINTSDNNVVKAGAALLNVPQYMEDFRTIWNSDYLKDRRSGLMNDVAEAELAQAMNDPRNKNVLDKFKSGLYWILKQGFLPTRIADSFAIAFGGAGFYRNRINTYLKKGETLEEAKHLTMRDFYEISEISQQSADVSKISMNQASVKGRLILAFQNTPLQYSRIIKKSVIDLVKGRGSVPNNIAKIVYYAAVQNIMFNFLQNALFAALWDDDDEQTQGKYDSAKMRALTGTMDTLLRGSGLQGALLATVKNVIIKWYEKSGDPKGFGDVALELANVAPAIGIKARALSKSYKAYEYNKDEINYKGFSLDNTYAIEALTSVTSAVTNIPADRIFVKAQNVSNALNSEYEAWQRIAFAMGYSKWNLGLGESGKVSIDTSGMLKVPELSQGELVTPELK